jgi:hypothetical protein
MHVQRPRFPHSDLLYYRGQNVGEAGGESVRLLSRVAFWGVIRALLLVINKCYPNHLSAHH